MAAERRCEGCSTRANVVRELSSSALSSQKLPPSNLGGHLLDVLWYGAARDEGWSSAIGARSMTVGVRISACR
jgi:hypothetical protein